MLVILAILFCLTFGIGVVAYHANFIQFGLDQLMEMPSKSLSLMIHWMIWADNFCFALIIPLASTILCHNRVPPAATAIAVSILCFVLLNIFLIILCRKRRWFHAEPGQHNPYKEVIKVLNFVRKHKYPLQRSAFTYCDDERPSRMDFAKERFGGPFSTEQVENVKTFLRIFLVLFAVGSVFVLEVSSSTFGFPLISTHIAFSGIYFCKIQWIFLESGTLRYVTSAVFIPIYVCILHKRKEIPKIFTRIGIGIFLYLIGSLTILLIDISGHAKNGNNCMMNFNKSSTLGIPRLKMHWGTLIPPNIFLGIGPLLVFISTLEFISAQSPSTMKGLIVGLCFTIKSVFQLLGSVALIPFSKIWQSKRIKEHHPPVISCGFGYLSCVLIVALIGFILFLVVAKRYKFRERDDRPYDQRFVIILASMTNT
jgi:peptide/histidine transporter 3/4